MMVQAPAILTLGPQTILRAPENILAYIMNIFAAAPRDATETYRALNLTISLADIMSRHGYRRTEIVDPISAELKSCLLRIFGAGNAAVTVTTEDIDDVRYSLVIAATVTVDGTPYTIAPSVTVENGRLIYAS